MPSFTRTGAANRIYVMALDLQKKAMDLRVIIGWVSSFAAPEDITFRSAIYVQIGRGLSFDDTLNNSILQGIPTIQLVPGTEAVEVVSTLAGSEQISQFVLPAPVRLNGHRNRYFLAITSPSANAEWATPGLLGAANQVLAATETFGTSWPQTLQRTAQVAGLTRIPVFQLLSEEGAVHLV